ncbi:hypothetical protein L596_004160 [Steinernema carpocapsae]|uniref:Uncharacterized protein n=1 Tax=Steinernema carpocapsae TaxID=34508 RepID=A0A4U8UWK6_STECR|nr:hypothetical protein L596_004160 [Steinernema carpocapsae]
MRLRSSKDICAAASHFVYQSHAVNRKDIVNKFNKDKELADQYKEKYAKDARYYSRNIGLFHICFPENLPSESGSFTWLGSPCVWRSNEYFPSEALRQNWGSTQTNGLHFLRGATISYAVGLVCIFFSLFVGIIGCWKRSTKLVSFTAVIMALGVLFCTIYIGLWFLMRYYETDNNVEPYIRSWEPFLKGAMRISYGWSLGVFIAGLTFLVLATVFMFWARFAIKSEEDKVLGMKAGAYMMNNYYEKSMMPFYGTYGSARTTRLTTTSTRRCPATTAT